MNSILKFIYWIFGVKFRKIYSPVIYWLLRWTVYRGKLPNLWKDYKNLPMDNFERVLNQYPYKPDFWSGILDSTLQEPDFFFVEDRKYFRDCDDFSKLWFLWATENNFSAWLMIVVDGWKFWRAHKYTLIRCKNDFGDIVLVTPYRVLRGHPDIETAMNQFKMKKLVAGGKYKNPIHLIYDQNFEELKK